MNIVLYRPEIPQNTGNIARTCASTGSALHLIRPLGFAIDDVKLKRAGLDYWHKLDIRYYDGFGAFLSEARPAALYPVTTHGLKPYTEARFKPDDFLIFGQETAGLPEEIRGAYAENCLRIPMIPQNRSLNLSNTVALVLYEALRQLGFAGLI
ncbi:MAG: tRNA (uridine(34)/cytosine(34)/5-carboxymethylaminomethyluridine(34)-2'-O)-methyltransferase TrmL [Oscillospiraceae bacterium]|jgi:tRNA (cytidine/uridine-2'-O-)-methyltransferase|nr:tRNA (uridine(34)/cytosine(34)/5-carboxymethylaminomethyluridine(34)-2'-O)-methyltransferase TrmL [Oscillospiraceae bacterium]